LKRSSFDRLIFTLCQKIVCTQFVSLNVFLKNVFFNVLDHVIQINVRRVFCVATNRKQYLCKISYFSTRGCEKRKTM